MANVNPITVIRLQNIHTLDLVANFPELIYTKVNCTGFSLLSVDWIVMAKWREVLPLDIVQTEAYNERSIL